MSRAPSLVLLLGLLAGCAQTPTSGEAQPAELPVASQPATGDASARAKAHAELGLLYLQAGQTGVALEEARASLEADPGYAPAHNLLGLVHMTLGEAKLAQASFDRAVRLAPNDPEINNNYGWFLCAQGRESEGLPRLLVSARNPLYATPTRPWFNAGLCALRLKNDKAAEDYFARAIQADPTNAAAVFQLADLEYRRGNYPEARRLVGDVHRVTEPTAQSVWLGLRVERKLGDRQAEANFASQLRRRFTGSPEHQAMLQGRFE